MATDTPSCLSQDFPSRHEALLARVLIPLPVFDCAFPQQPCREAVEQYVADHFASVFGARIQEFMPVLLSLSCLGRLSGVAGIRSATETLFLEQYLTLPVEVMLRQQTGDVVQRDRIVEIGNLVATRKGASQIVFVVMSMVLHRLGFQWMVFTATRLLRNNLDRLGLDMMLLGTASAGKLEPGQEQAWGSYYAADPVVVAARLDQAMAVIRARPLCRRISRLYRDQIDSLARQVRESGHHV